VTSPLRQLAECDRETVRGIAAPGGVLVLPIGAIEQHGPHLPVWTDTLVVEYIAGQAAKRLAGDVPVLVAPVLPYGSSDHHLPFGGTLSLRTSTLMAVLADLGRSAVIAGFTKVFLLNGHGGNHEIAEIAARDLSLEHNIDAAAASWWNIAWPAILDTDAFEHGRVPGHAGAFETALVLALRPDLVRPTPTRPGSHATDPTHVRPPVRVERGGFWQSIEGWTDQPGSLGADLGRRVLDAAIAGVADALRDFHGLPATGG
jgi:creatinine amidohydrolase